MITPTTVHALLLLYDKDEAAVRAWLAADRRIVRLSEIVLDDGRALLARAKQEGWEGLIVKDVNAVYHSGRRTPAWRKMKLLKQQEFVVGGWTEPRQTRQHFGALLIGYYDEAGALRWAGSVGTGFDQAELDRVSGCCARSKSSSRHSPTRSRRPSSRTGSSRNSWPSCASPSGRATASCANLCLGMRTDKKARAVRREEQKAPAKPVLPAPAMWKKNRRTQKSPANEGGRTS